ncbi:DUF547 domain-containing protein [Pseudidiomarina sp. YC-516-91]|uniref:DUF547 domain-containing protein n=1 Tax=Pseudidiomarina salilacus TaxID=3384452 RepID=UPI00398507B8
MKNKLLCWFALFVVGVSAVQAQDAFDHSHADFTEVLQAHVVVYDEGQRSVVDYAALQSDETLLQDYLQQLSAVSMSAYRDWTAEQQLAFLINAYNAFTLELINANYADFADGDAASIRDLGSFFTSPWEREFFTLLGAERSLDWLEHETIRIDFDEPRIHAALVCAAMSCPKLRAEAFVAERLDAQLDDQMQTFLHDRSKNGIDDQGLYLSRIFDWYEDDFDDLRVYMRQYSDALADTHEQEEALAGDIRIRYTDYDWSLNSPENAGL